MKKSQKVSCNKFLIINNKNQNPTMSGLPRGKVNLQDKTIILIIRIENPVEENIQGTTEIKTIFKNLTILVNNQEIMRETISLKNIMIEIKIEIKIEMMAIKIKENLNAISDRINIIQEIIKTKLNNLPLQIKKLILIISNRKISNLKDTKINHLPVKTTLKINTLKKFQINNKMDLLKRATKNIIRKKIILIIRTMIQVN